MNKDVTNRPTLRPTFPFAFIVSSGIDSAQAVIANSTRPYLNGCAVEELVRFDGPVQSTRRILTGPATIHGVDLQKGDSVAVVLAAANRDPALCAEPDTLDVARPDPGHVGFGHGLHFCLGAPLARLEAQHAFRALLERLPQLELAVPHSALAYTTSFFLRGLTALPLRRAC